MIGIIKFPGRRSDAYFQMIRENNFHIDYVIDAHNAKTINDDWIYKEVKNNPQDYWIYTGGGIVEKRLLKIARLIHMHPGQVPDYKGSTCFYYSILNNNTITVSALFMNEQIDGGNVILQKTFSKLPGTDFDEFGDPNLRARTLKKVLLKYEKENKLTSRKQKGKGETYYVIHPVLKHIALLKVRK